MSGWLPCTARNLAAKSVRAEVPRWACQQEAATMHQLSFNPFDSFNWAACSTSRIPGITVPFLDTPTAQHGGKEANRAGATPLPHRSLPVAPLIADQRGYGEAPVR